MIKRVLLGVALLLAAAIGAQAQTARVTGTVVDESGGVVPGATVTLAGDAGRHTTTTGPEGAYTFENVAAGTYRVTVTLLGFAEGTSDDLVVSSGDAAVPAITLRIGELGETVIVSASKVESALIDAPATMSVVTTETLESSPASNYADLLRSVPGINAIQMSARDVNLTSRQATSTLATSQLALLDGRSIYLDFFGLILWDFVPSNPEDIKQIEVVRGPASAVWGANALTGVVNIITKPPREAVGTTVTFSAGLFSRGAGSTEGRDPGAQFGAGATVARAPNDRLAYRLSAGYFYSDAFPRPTGQIPLITDPRDPTKRVGGGFYPADTAGAFGTAYENVGTSQPKFDARVDQELAGGGRVTYSGGIAGTEGTIYSGIGPFDIQPGSVLGYARVGFERRGLRIAAFGNFLDAEAPNLLLPDPRTGRPLQLDFSTQTYDVEVGHSTTIGAMHVLTYGGNARHNEFEITLAPGAENRNEFGAYIQDEIFLDPFRFSIGGRLDKFGNLEDPVFSPRLSALVKATPDHAIRFSFNKAFRSPSVVNNFLDIAIVNPIDLRAIGIPQPFPLVVRAVGSELPIGSNPPLGLREESLTAYEVAYTGTVADRTTLGFAFYVNDVDDNINFSQLPSSLDPYTAANPPPGWPLPPAVLALLAQQGIFLPRTAFTYLNLGPIRNKGIEVSVDHRLGGALSAFANYSWQDDPEVLDDPNPHPTDELALPPTHRFNVGFNYGGERYLGSLSVNYSDDAFWSDVLTSQFHGFTDAYTMVNGSGGVRWLNGRVTTSVKVTNIFNEDVQQHVFGDIIKRQTVFELKLSY
jgi:iron complex outermembrane receptor protein